MQVLGDPNQEFQQNQDAADLPTFFLPRITPARMSRNASVGRASGSNSRFSASAAAAIAAVDSSSSREEEEDVPSAARGLAAVAGGEGRWSRTDILSGRADLLAAAAETAGGEPGGGGGGGIVAVSRDRQSSGALRGISSYRGSSGQLGTSRMAGLSGGLSAENSSELLMVNVASPKSPKPGSASVLASGFNGPRAEVRSPSRVASGSNVLSPKAIRDDSEDSDDDEVGNDDDDKGWMAKTRWA